MSGRIANCPNCGGQVEFRADTSLLSICPYCSSAVARTGGDIGHLEILGKVAPLAAIGSPLSVGTSGKLDRVGFTLVGRLQLDYGAGPWNEWYAALDDGTWAWVAEAQGRCYVTRGRELPNLPSWESARVGSRFDAGRVSLTVVERRKARFVAAEGELPEPVVPGSELRYCDLEGANGVFGTIDYGDGTEPPVLYLGRQVEYRDLFDASVLRDVRGERAAGTEAMNCPNCGSAVELRAPDDAQRVTCGTCESLLDASQGTKLHLLSAARPAGRDPLIPVGSVGNFRGVKWTVFGHLLRSVTVEGTKYFWEEYLLRADSRGYRWLVCSENHWSWVEPIHAGEVKKTRRSVEYKGRTFKHFQSATARVEALRGEFYWKVAVGERVSASDFVDPPNVLSEEVAEDEVTWSLGTYLETADVERAFGLKQRLPKPRGVGAMMPNPWGPRLRASARVGAVMTGLLVVVALLVALTSGEKAIHQSVVPVTQRSPGAGTTGQAVTTEPFVVEDRSALEIEVRADVPTSWLFVAGSLVSQDGYAPRPFGVSVRGDEGGLRTIYLGAVAPGTYSMSLEPEWGAGATPPVMMTVTVREDVFFESHFLMATLLLWLVPMFALFGYYGLEKKRWAESDHG
ncbi:DUF4178 domain-containing protein [Myxococcota bacterium]|nr:DUF4178 domain-containing protein [Myxococcota bacterium]